MKICHCRNQSDFRLSEERFKRSLLDQANWMQVRVVIKQLGKLTINHEPRRIKKTTTTHLLSCSASEAALAGVVVVVVDVVAAQCLKSFCV